MQVKDSKKSEGLTPPKSFLKSEVFPLERICWIYMCRWVFFERSSLVPSFKNQNSFFSTTVSILKVRVDPMLFF